MSKRYRLTREFQEAAGSISLEECKQYFATQPDFTHTPVYTVKGSVSKEQGAATMKIEGDSFMWSYGDASIPFRHYDGDVYVSGSNDAVIPRMMEVATALRADISAEGPEA